MSCINIQFCMQADGYSELNTNMSSHKYGKRLAKRKVVYQTQQTEALCLSVYLYSAKYMFQRYTRYCVAKQ